MFVSEISFWGAVLVACLVLVASIALAFIDRQMLRRMLVIFGATVVQMAVVVAVVWLVYQTNAGGPICSGSCWYCFCQSAGSCILYSLCGKRCCGP